MELSQPTKGVVADTDDMADMLFMVNSESSNTLKSQKTSTDFTTTEPMERQWLSPVRRQSVDREPNHISSVFAALSCIRPDAHQSDRSEKQAARLVKCVDAKPGSSCR